MFWGHPTIRPIIRRLQLSIHGGNDLLLFLMYNMYNCLSMQFIICYEEQLRVIFLNKCRQLLFDQRHLVAECLINDLQWEREDLDPTNQLLHLINKSRGKGPFIYYDLGGSAN